MVKFHILFITIKYYNYFTLITLLYAKNVAYDFYSIGFKTEKKGKEALQLWTSIRNILESTNILNFTD